MPCACDGLWQQLGWLGACRWQAALLPRLPPHTQKKRSRLSTHLLQCEGHGGSHHTPHPPQGRLHRCGWTGGGRGSERIGFEMEECSEASRSPAATTAHGTPQQRPRRLQVAGKPRCSEAQLHRWHSRSLTGGAGGAGHASNGQLHSLRFGCVRRHSHTSGRLPNCPSSSRLHTPPLRLARAASPCQSKCAGTPPHTANRTHAPSTNTPHNSLLHGQEFPCQPSHSLQRPLSSMQGWHPHLRCQAGRL